MCLSGLDVARVCVEGLERRDALGGADECCSLVDEQTQRPGDRARGACFDADLDAIAPVCRPVPPDRSRDPAHIITFDGV